MVGDIPEGDLAYKLTFEDGSDAYLAHYGVKGMTWDPSKKKGVQPLIKTGKKGGGNAAKSRANVKSKAKGLIGLLGKSKKAKTSGKKTKKKKGKTYANRKSHSEIRASSAAKYAEANSNYKAIKARLKARREAGYSS